MWDTDIASGRGLGRLQKELEVAQVSSAIRLRASYAMPGTDSPRAMQCPLCAYTLTARYPILTYLVLLVCDVW